MTTSKVRMNVINFDFSCRLAQTHADECNNRLQTSQLIGRRVTSTSASNETRRRITLASQNVGRTRNRHWLVQTSCTVDESFHAATAITIQLYRPICLDAKRMNIYILQQKPRE